MNKITKQGDKVDISAKSKEIAGIISAINQLPEVREKMVRAIKQRVEAGSYTVDPNKVAEKILKEADNHNITDVGRVRCNK